MISWKSRNRLLRRSLFVFGNLAFGAVVGIAILKPVVAFFSERETLIAEQQALLARLGAIAAQDARVRSIERSIDDQMQHGEFLAGPNENVINADLQTRLKTIAGSAGARSHVIQGLPAKTNGQIKYTGARIEIFGTLQSIYRAVLAIEGATPYLFIDGAVIKIAPTERRTGGPTEPVIQAQFDVFSAFQIKGHGL